MPLSKQLFSRAEQLIPGGVNSPVRTFQNVDMDPIYFKRGEGAYMIDVDDKNEVTLVDLAIDYTQPAWGIGASSVGGLLFDGVISELYFNTAEYLDFSIEANRRLFISADGYPVDLGLSGQKPTGTAPIVYMRSPADNAGLNSGTGGDFTIYGSPTSTTGPKPIRLTTWVSGTSREHWDCKNPVTIATNNQIFEVEEVVWTNDVGVSVSSNSLMKTAVNGWGNSGAVSTRAISSGDGYMEFTASETNTGRILGLSLGDMDQNYTDIDFAAMLSATGDFHVYESGNSRGNFGSYSTNDLLRVAVVSGEVVYSHNGRVFYRSGLAPTYPLLVDSALMTNSAMIIDVFIVGVVLE